MSAAAVIAIRRKRLIKRFQEVGATTPEQAVTLEALGQRRSWIFDQMTEHRVFVRTHDGRFFIDERAAAEFLRRRRNLALLLGAILLMVFLLLWVFGALAK